MTGPTRATCSPTRELFVRTGMHQSPGQSENLIPLLDIWCFCQVQAGPRSWKVGIVFFSSSCDLQAVICHCCAVDWKLESMSHVMLLLLLARRKLA